MPDGKVNPALWEARKRGVLFDVGHGGGSFWFRNGITAMEQGFPPDSLSTDLHVCVNGLEDSMMSLCGKFMAMGMPMEEVIYRSTWTPAQQINRTDLGHLSVGAIADVSVFDVRKGKFGFWDCGRAKVIGDKKLDCMLTFQGGELAYDGCGMNKPLWRDAPPKYWE